MPGNVDGKSTTSSRVEKKRGGEKARGKMRESLGSIELERIY